MLTGDPLPIALQANWRTLRDAEANSSDRALALSWVLHLVGDAHQPLHTVALFTKAAFVAGDRGGNDILVRGRGPLHGVWDDLLGTDASWPSVEAAARALEHAGPAPGKGATRELGVEHWLLEGCDVARRAVYVPSIQSGVGRFERRAREQSAGPAMEHAKPEITLGPEYFRYAERLAEARVRLAGLRLASMLSELAPGHAAPEGGPSYERPPAGAR
jgi:hypothetical protein